MLRMLLLVFSIFYYINLPLSLLPTNMVDGLSRCELVFENCFVPEENLLGQEGKGSFILFSCVSFEEDLCKMFDV
jgi:hypothetical protein